MKIVVVGGTGRVGSRLCAMIERAGHEVVPASPSTGVDTTTGAGLEDALRGARVVIDVSNPRAWGESEVRDFFRTSTDRLLAAGATAGVGHHVVLSVVGCDLAAGSAYLGAKADQERAVAAGSVPHTIVRATQFFEFLDGILDAATDGGVVRLPPADLQPIAVEDVAAVLAEVVGEPSGSMELAGPERSPMTEWAQRVLDARSEERRVMEDVGAKYFGAPLERDTLVPHGPARLGARRFDEWLRDLDPLDRGEGDG